MRTLTPDLTGLDLLSARNLAADCGLDISVTLAETASVRPGVVASQSPEPGAAIRMRSRIHIVVASSVQVVVPDVRGRSPDDATVAMRARGLHVIRSHDRWSRLVAAKRVVETRPRAGELVAIGSLVRLICDRGEPPIGSVRPADAAHANVRRDVDIGSDDRGSSRHRGRVR